MSKIAIYSSKGSAGKTPIAANFYFEKDFCIGTNEAFHVYDSFVPKNQLLSIKTEERFADVGDIDIVFDLAGSISKGAVSITSALESSDFVIVPIYNEFKSLVAGINTMLEVANYNENIIVIATKLEKRKKDLTNDWTKVEDFLNIKKSVSENFSKKTVVLPLKKSLVFDSIFEKKISIKQIMKTSPLLAHSYKEVDKQFDDIFKHTTNK